MFNSYREICNRLDIDYSKDVEYIKDEIRKIQKSTHPDTAPNAEDAKELIRLANAAMDFIKKHPQKEQELVAASDIADLILSVNNKNELAQLIKESEKNLDNTYEKSIKQVKTFFRPLRITSGTIAAAITVIWGFPSIITENPIISKLISMSEYTDVYLGLTLIWLFSLVFLIEVFTISKIEEHKFENMLSNFKNKEFQYNVFSDFIMNIRNEKRSDNLSFFRKDFEKFIIEEILKKHRIRKYSPYSLYGLRKLYNIDVYINELSPKLSEMIINRAIEQKIIVKSDEATWEDKYIIIAPEGF